MEKDEQMTRAERAAEEAYPPFVVKTLSGEFDCNASSRLLFWRGYQQALDEMLEDAVECEVDWYDGYYLNFSLEQIRDAVDKIGAGVGDKVRIVVLKEEEDER